MRASVVKKFAPGFDRVFAHVLLFPCTPLLFDKLLYSPW